MSDKLKLGFDNYAIRALDWKAPRLIEYAASLNLDTIFSPTQTFMGATPKAI